jgi:photosynthetic reaction center H subunit
VARRTAVWPGAPIEPTGDPLVDGVGPASYALRADTPDCLHDGAPKIVPLRAAPGFLIAAGDPDPRGWTVYGCDRRAAGIVREVWLDRMEYLLRYLELELLDGEGRPNGVRKLLPMAMSVLENSARRVNVRSIRSDQFARVPDLKQPDQITFLEEDRIVGYYGGGYLYALPSRQEPWL